MLFVVVNTVIHVNKYQRISKYEYNVLHYPGIHGMTVYCQYSMLTW